LATKPFVALANLRYINALNNNNNKATSALEVFLNDMRYINPRFTYLLTYLPPTANKQNKKLPRSKRA